MLFGPWGVQCLIPNYITLSQNILTFCTHLLMMSNFTDFVFVIIMALFIKQYPLPMKTRKKTNKEHNAFTTNQNMTIQ